MKNLILSLTLLLTGGLLVGFNSDFFTDVEPKIVVPENANNVVSGQTYFYTGTTDASGRVSIEHGIVTTRCVGGFGEKIMGVMVSIEHPNNGTWYTHESRWNKGSFGSFTDTHIGGFIEGYGNRPVRFVVFTQKVIC